MLHSGAAPTGRAAGLDMAAPPGRGSLAGRTRHRSLGSCVPGIYQPTKQRNAEGLLSLPPSSGSDSLRPPGENDAVNGQD